MATLIPSIGTCAGRMTSGERRLAERLEQKLDDDYLLWYDVPMGTRNTHPDFCRKGQAPIIIKLPSLREEAFAIADQLSTAQKEGFAWGDMAILCADWHTIDTCADALYHRKLPFNVRKRSGDYNPSADAIQIMTMKVSKGLEFPVVSLPGVGHMPAAGEDEQEAAP
jgi:superfamily I DNA/RNA helicase